MTEEEFQASLRKRTRQARCKYVLCVLGNRLETVDLIREEVYPQTGGDFEVGPLEVAIVRYKGLEVSVPLDTVVFLRDVPQGPPRDEIMAEVRKARAKCRPAKPNPIIYERRKRQKVIQKNLEGRVCETLKEPGESTNRKGDEAACIKRP